MQKGAEFPLHKINNPKSDFGDVFVGIPSWLAGPFGGKYSFGGEVYPCSFCIFSLMKCLMQVKTSFLETMSSALRMSSGSVSLT